MMRNFSKILIACASAAAMTITACSGGGGSDTASVMSPPPPPPPPPTALSLSPTINESPTAGGGLSFSEGDIVSLAFSPADTGITSANMFQLSGPEVDFGNFQVGGISDGNNLNIGGDFTFSLSDKEGLRTATLPASSGPLIIDVPLPAVMGDTPITFELEFSDGTQSIEELITFTVAEDPNSTIITLNGTVNSISEARVIVTDATEPLTARVADETVLGEAITDADGAYSITVDTADFAGDLLGVTAILEDSFITCPATSGCGPDISFGGEFLVIDGVADLDVGDGNGVREFDATLGAVVDLPAGSSVSTINVNELTQLTISRMVAAALGADSRDADGDLILRSADLAGAQSYIANVFDLPLGTDATQISFVDITQNITSTNQVDILAALVGGGFFEAGAQRGQLSGLDFAELFIGNQFPFLGFLATRVDPSVQADFITLENIIDGALLATDSSVMVGTNAQTLMDAQAALNATSDLIDAAAVNSVVQPNGDLP